MFSRGEHLQKQKSLLVFAGARPYARVHARTYTYAYPPPSSSSIKDCCKYMYMKGIAQNLEGVVLCPKLEEAPAWGR